MYEYHATGGCAAVMCWSSPKCGAIHIYRCIYVCDDDDDDDDDHDRDDDRLTRKRHWTSVGAGTGGTSSASSTRYPR